MVENIESKLDKQNFEKIAENLGQGASLLIFTFYFPFSFDI